MENKNPFDVPPEGAIPAQAIEFLRVEYAALKTPEAYANQANSAVLSENEAKGKLGFSYWDKEAAARVAINPFTFVVLEVYSIISGSVQEANGDWTQFYSNRIKDSRTEEFLVWNGGRDPIAKGIYSNIKNSLPKGAGFHVNLIAWCVELGRLIEIKTTAGVSRQIQRAISEAEARAGRKRNPERISLFGLADTELFWGFQFKAYLKQDKDGNEYNGKGELYFAPEFYAGTIQANSGTQYAALYAICKEQRDAIRAAYEDRKKRFANKPDQEVKQEEQIPIQDGNLFPTEEPEAPSQWAGTGYDDLPF